jgi:hypothetical protein
VSDFQNTYQDYRAKLELSIKNHERIISQLRTFLIQRKDVQTYIFEDLFKLYFTTQQLMAEIIDKDINIDSITKYNSGISKVVPDDDDEYIDDDDDSDTNNVITK